MLDEGKIHESPVVQLHPGHHPVVLGHIDRMLVRLHAVRALLRRVQQRIPFRGGDDRLVGEAASSCRLALAPRHGIRD